MQKKPFHIIHSLFFPLLLLIFTLSAQVKNDDEVVRMLEFYNADISSVINYVSDITGYTIITDPSVAGKVSISSKQSITVRESIDLIESLLQGMGYSFETEGNILRVVPIKDSSQIKGIYTDIEEIESLSENKMLTYLRPLQSEQGEGLLRNLKPFQSKFGNMLYDASANKLIITDFRDQILQIEKLIEQLDIGDVSDEAFTEIIELENLNIDEVREFVKASFGDILIETDSRYPASRRISPRSQNQTKEDSKIQILNFGNPKQVLLIGDRASVTAVKDMIIDLDEKFIKNAPNLEYEIVNVTELDQNNLIQLLNQLTTLDPRRSEKTSLIQLKGKIEYFSMPRDGLLVIIGESQDRQAIIEIINSLKNELRQQQERDVRQSIRIIPIQHQKSENIVGLLGQLQQSHNDRNRDQEDLQILNFNSANSVILKGSEASLNLMEQLISEMDVRSLQVLIEVQIFELNYNDDLDLGVDYDNISLSSLFGSSDADFRAIFSGIAPSTADDESPRAFLSSTDESVIFNALAKFGQVDLVSTPNILTLNNKTAEINITDQKAVANQELRPSDNGEDTIATSYEYKDAGLKLTITPQINEGKNISLNINLLIENFSSVENIENFPDIKSRTLTSEIVVQDQRTAILGGIIETTESDVMTGIPGLVKIPYLNRLFGKTSKVKEKKELIILLTPHIVDDYEELHQLSQKRLKQSVSQMLSTPKEEEKDKKRGWFRRNKDKEDDKTEEK